MAGYSRRQRQGTRIAVAFLLLSGGVGAIIAVVQLERPDFLWAIMGACLAISALLLLLPWICKVFGCTTVLPGTAPRFTHKGLGWKQLDDRKQFKAQGKQRVAAGFQVLVNVWPNEELPKPVILRLHFSADIEKVYAHLYPSKIKLDRAVTIGALLPSGPIVTIDLSESNQFRTGSMISVVATSKVSGCRFRFADRQVPG